jgi:tetratricopeptide (TPR) repeat protein
MFGQHYVVLARFESRDADAAGRALDLYEDRARELRQPLLLWRATVLRTFESLLAARFEDAERLAQQALQLGEQAQDADALNIYAGQVGMVRMEHDRLVEMRPVLASFVEQLPETPWWDVTLAHLDAVGGHLDEARERFERLAADDFAMLPKDFAWLAGMAMLTVVCGALGDEPRARTLQRLLEPYASSNAIAATRMAFGPVAMYLGILAATSRDFDRAEAWIDQALAANTKMGATGWAAHTRYHRARMLLARGGPGDHGEASRLLAETRTEADRRGMTRLARMAAEASASIPR